MRTARIRTEYDNRPIKLLANGRGFICKRAHRFRCAVAAFVYTALIETAIETASFENAVERKALKTVVTYFGAKLAGSQRVNMASLAWSAVLD